MLNYHAFCRLNEIQKSENDKIFIIRVLILFILREGVDIVSIINPIPIGGLA